MVSDELQILAGLERAKAEGGDLEAVYALHLAVRVVQAAAKAEILGRQKAASRPSAPLGPLPFDDLGVDHVLLADTGARLAKVIGGGSPANGEGDAPLTTERCLAEARRWYDSRLPPAGSAAASATSVVVAHALVPWLEVAAAGGDAAARAAWRRATCPVCGGYPDLALLSPENGERLLVCGRCSADWGYRRLGCTFCRGGESEADVYHEGFAVGDRLYVCDACGAYLKALDLRQHGAPVVAQVERVRLLPLDVAAEREGYRAGFAVVLGIG